jgi:hypothetical protein
MRWVVYNGGKVIEVMWFMAGKWAVEKLVFPWKMRVEDEQQHQHQEVQQEVQHQEQSIVESEKPIHVPEGVPEN